MDENMIYDYDSTILFYNAIRNIFLNNVIIPVDKIVYKEM